MSRNRAAAWLAGVLLLTPAFVGLLAAYPIAAYPMAADPVDQVRPMAGTSNSRWMLFPGPSLPMGMVKLSPDNQANVWNGGYEYTVASISGFSLLHSFGMRGFALMPTVGALNLDPTSSRFHPGAPDGPFGGMWTAGWRSRIDKATESATPGSYAVDLMDSGVRAELTATDRTGWLRFTWPQADQAHIVLDFDPPAEEQIATQHVQLTQVSPTRLEGEMIQSGNYASTYTLYFVIETSKAVSNALTFVNAPYTAAIPVTARRGAARPISSPLTVRSKGRAARAPCLISARRPVSRSSCGPASPSSASTMPG